MQRQKRIAEFKREEMMKALENKRHRTDHMLGQRAMLLEERKRAGIKAKLQRDHLVDTMAKIRLQKNWAKAEHVLKDVLGTGGGAGAREAPPQRKTNSSAVRDETRLPQLESDHRRARSAAQKLEQQQRGGKKNNNMSALPASYNSPYDEPHDMPKRRGGKRGKKGKKKGRGTQDDGRKFMEQALAEF